MDLIINAKGEMLTKTDGKMQITLRVKDPETGDIHKYLLFVNESPKKMAKTTKAGEKYGEITHFVSGIHKGKKSAKDEKDKMVKFTELSSIKHSFEGKKTESKVSKTVEAEESPF